MEHLTKRAMGTSIKLQRFDIQTIEHKAYKAQLLNTEY